MASCYRQIFKINFKIHSLSEKKKITHLLFYLWVLSIHCDGEAFWRALWPWQTHFKEGVTSTTWQKQSCQVVAFSAVLFSCSALYRCQSIESLRWAATFFSSQLQGLVFSLEIDGVHLFSPKRSGQLCFVHKHRYFLYSTTSIHLQLID